MDDVENDDDDVDDNSDNEGMLDGCSFSFKK